jgi:hypothetical protein
MTVVEAHALSLDLSFSSLVLLLTVRPTVCSVIYALPANLVTKFLTAVYTGGYPARITWGRSLNGPDGLSPHGHCRDWRSPYGLQPT